MMRGHVLFPVCLLVSLFLHLGPLLYVDGGAGHRPAAHRWLAGRPAEAVGLARVVFARAPSPVTPMRPARKAPETGARKVTVAKPVRSRHADRHRPDRSRPHSRRERQAPSRRRDVVVPMEPPVVREVGAVPVRRDEGEAGDVHAMEERKAEASPAPEESVGGRAATAAPAVRPGGMADERRRYLALLLQCIEAHKYYPRVARRRGIEGFVDVSFLLGPEGAIDSLVIEGGNGILERAARRAVQSAMPLPPPPSGLTMPFEVAYRMDFRIVD